MSLAASPRGQALTQRPHWMQLLALGSLARSWEKARMALLFFRMGWDRSATQVPIMGPP